MLRCLLLLVYPVLGKSQVKYGVDRSQKTLRNSFKSGGPMITLKPVDEKSVEACASLQCTPEQRQFTNSPIWSLLETAYTPLRQHCQLYAIYSDDTVVGMVRLDFTLHENFYEFTNLLIDQKYQRKHYASEAIRQIIEIFQRHGQYHILKILAAPDNTSAIQLYQNQGFVYSGVSNDGVFLVYQYML